MYCVGVMDFDNKQVGGLHLHSLSVTDTVSCLNTEVLFVFLCVYVSVCVVSGLDLFAHLDLVS